MVFWCRLVLINATRKDFLKILENFPVLIPLLGMKYSVWFPTHGVRAGSLRGWLDRLFDQPAYRLDPERQAMVARSISEVCLDRGWRLIAVEPGERDVVAVVESAVRPERVIHDFKIAASLALASLDGDGPDRKRFNRRARVRYLKNEQSSAAAAGHGF